MAGLIGDFPLDELNAGQVANRADPKKPGQTSEGPELVEGGWARALRLSGENNVTLPTGQFRPLPAVLAVPVVEDARFQGSGRDHSPLDGVDRRRQPGLSALDRRRQAQCGLDPLLAGQCDRHSSREPVPLNQWVHVTITYDGSSRASGLWLFTSTAAAPRARSIRDQLTKNITGGGNDHLTVGQRFRDRGFKNGLVDEIKVFDRAADSRWKWPSLTMEKHSRRPSRSTRPG